MNILMVLTSHEQLGETGKKTGFWLEEFAAPYYVFKDAGARVTLASPKGGQPPQDPKSDEPDYRTEATERFREDDEIVEWHENSSSGDAVAHSRKNGLKARRLEDGFPEWKTAGLPIKTGTEN